MTKLWHNKFQNCQCLESNFGFPKWIFFRSLLIFQFKRFEKFAIRKIPRISNFKNFKNWLFQKFREFPFRNISKMFTFENSKNFKFGNFQKLPIWEVTRIVNSENSKNFQNLKISKSFYFWNCTISKNSKFSKFHYLKNFLNSIKSQVYKLSFFRVKIISTNIKIKNKFKIKESKNSSFVILIFAILEFWNIAHSIFNCFKFWPPPILSLFYYS